jgi:hypothetical protein
LSPAELDSYNEEQSRNRIPAQRGSAINPYRHKDKKLVTTQDRHCFQSLVTRWDTTEDTLASFASTV